MKENLLLKKIFKIRPLVILGIGSELRSDDGWAYHFINELNKFIPKNVYCIWTGTVPENFISVIAKLVPKEVIICDAGNFNSIPGTYRIFTCNRITDTELYLTHKLPLKFLSQMIHESIECSIHFLLMQPATVEVSEQLSLQVKKSINKLVSELKNDCLKK
jgi:hydrogenase maturation protease